MVVPKSLRKNSRVKNEEDDEDYVPELGADSDSDCSEPAGGNAGSDVEEEEEEEEEEILEEEEEEILEEEVVEEAGVELTLSTDDVENNASSDKGFVFTPTVLSIPAATAGAPTSQPVAAHVIATAGASTSQPVATHVIATAGASSSQPVATHVISADKIHATVPSSSSSSSSMFSPTYLYLTESGSVAVPVSSIHVTNAYQLQPAATPAATPLGTASHSPPVEYVAIQEPASVTVATASTMRSSNGPHVELLAADTPASALPPEFMNLINSTEFQR